MRKIPCVHRVEPCAISLEWIDLIFPLTSILAQIRYFVNTFMAILLKTSIRATGDFTS